MRQYDVYRLSQRNAERRPCLLVVQSNWFKHEPRIIAVPLIPVADVGHVPHGVFSPEFQIEGQTVRMDTLGLAAFPRSAFGDLVGSLEDEGDRIIAALDFVLGRGYR